MGTDRVSGWRGAQTEVIQRAMTTAGIFRALIRLGARPLVLGEVLSVVLVAGGFDGCGGGGEIQFPDPDAGAVVCGGVECPSSRCYVNVHCNPEKPSECIGDGYTKDFDDHNACTVEACGADGWEHMPLKPEDLDDGDACTVDQCDVGSGPVHTNTCA